jgi:hypothetical protein
LEYRWRIITEKDIFGPLEEKELQPTNQSITKIGGGVKI